MKDRAYGKIYIRMELTPQQVTKIIKEQRANKESTAMNAINKNLGLQ